jgi:hypothetical protein
MSDRRKFRTNLDGGRWTLQREATVVGKDELYRTGQGFAPTRELGYKHQFRVASQDLCVIDHAYSRVGHVRFTNWV